MLIDGNAVAKIIQNRIKDQVSQLTGRKPCLAVILVGNHPASTIYVRRKAQACLDVGIISVRKTPSEDISENDLLALLDQLNKDPAVDGILVQLPLPKQINTSRVIQNILPEKDVDGFHPINMGKLLLGDEDGFIPCTPLGIKTLLEHYQIETAGKQALIIGRSNIVGKPMAVLLMLPKPGGNATVTVAHSKTRNIETLCRNADILIAASGQPHFVNADMVKEGAVVIDVGINKIDDPNAKQGYRLIGDVDFEHVKDKCSYITPVPGGVGPMTIAMLLQNAMRSYLKRTGKM